LSSSKTKLAKSSHPTTELVVCLIDINEENLLRALADTSTTSSSSIVGAYTLDASIKNYKINTTIWSTIGGNFTSTKTGFVTFSLPEFNVKKQLCSPWTFHVDDRSESSSTYDTIIYQKRGLPGELGIIMNFYDHAVTWDTDTIPIKDRDTALYHQQRP
jgi:hypothetical protein